MPSQDKKIADTLENLAAYLDNSDDIIRGKLSLEDYVNYISAIRYAIAKIRGG